ncbi:MAG: carboxylating nicotinate-nucleotide diphosphorylase [Verrucomicrobiota bacterium JB022]|nr:carboxylating nicotinate-nucleotide diphosphorylase [Verrucomicrobiota bacterium JB022]
MSAAFASDWSQQITWAELDPASLRELIARARDEDLAGAGLREAPRYRFDVTSALLPHEKQGRAAVVAREEIAVAGLPLIPLLIEAYGAQCAWTPYVQDGAVAQPKDELGLLEGSARDILQLERLLLNFLQKLSGVATETRAYVIALGDSPTRLLDTRKTTPGYRLLEKYAVAQAGGWNHRLGLYDRVMLKDNHLAATGATAGASLTDVVRQARERYPDLLIQVEVDAVEQIQPALDAGAHWFLLDNFSTSELAQAVDLIGVKAATEASGGITLARLAELSTLGLDFISTGATVHQSRWKDIGLDWRI